MLDKITERIKFIIICPHNNSPLVVLHEIQHKNVTIHATKKYTTTSFTNCPKLL